MRAPVRLNLLRPHDRSRTAAFVRAVSRPLAIGLMAGVLVGSSARWIAGGQVDRATGESWSVAAQTDLAVASSSDHDRLEDILRLATELEHLGWLEKWKGVLDSPFGWVIVDDTEMQAILERRAQLRSSLRGAIEAYNRDLERIAALPEQERDATLRVLAFGRWRLQGGTYSGAVQFYSHRQEEIAKRPTATPTVPATPTPTPTAGRRKPLPTRAVRH